MATIDKEFEYGFKELVKQKKMKTERLNNSMVKSWVTSDS